MYLQDMNTERVYTLADLKNDWQIFKDESPHNHADDFTMEFFEILMDTINGRNDCHVIGLTPRELGDMIEQLRAVVMDLSAGEEGI